MLKSANKAKIIKHELMLQSKAPLSTGNDEYLINFEFFAFSFRLSHVEEEEEEKRRRRVKLNRKIMFHENSTKKSS